MALIKSLALPTGVSAEYFRMVTFGWDRTTRQASAHFALYKDAATAATPGSAPLVPIAAKLRLSGDRFDEYLSPAALAAAAGDVVAQLYQAAKDISEEYEADPTLGPGDAYLATDFGRDLFADAVDG